MAWTTAQDVKDLWFGGVLPTDQKLDKMIGVVERQIKTYYPQIQERVDEAELDVANIVDVVVNVITEFLMFEGKPLQHKSQAYVGASSQQESYSTSQARYSLTLTQADYDRLAPDGANSVMSLDMMPHARISKTYTKVVGWRDKMPVRYFYEED